ncbi:MAG: M20 family metallo-hydrolase [Flavobacteriales bacterium]|nr:M20 family metallo-hydrolase [Flavobacteriales bacterium]
MSELTLHGEAIQLLKQLIATPSFSGEENGTADLIQDWLKDHGVETERLGNNVWALNAHFDVAKPTILLNSHHDTVKPNKAYTRDPFLAQEEAGTLYGLGSNDAGGCLVSLLATFLHFYERKELKYNLLIAASAEEENSGANGISSLLPLLPPIACGVVGEPTSMNMAVAEKGLMVIDGTASGTAGHAAHENADNALYNALDDINLIRHFAFPKVSESSGKVKATVTQIEAGQQHNVVPAACKFVVDVRVNEHYTNQEVFEILNSLTKSELKARSFRLNSSSIANDHPLVKAGLALGRKTYGSPTLSDQALMAFPTVKMGPGESTRSHQADEFVLLSEIEEGISLHIQLLEKLL